MSKKFLSLILTALLFCGCQQAQPTETTTEPTAEVTTQPTNEPTTEFTAEATEPPLVLESGPEVYVDGTLLSGSWFHEGTLYVDATEFAAGRGGLELDEDVYSFENGKIYRSGIAVVPASPILIQDGASLIPLLEMCETFRLSVYDDAEMNTIYCTSEAWVYDIPEGYDVPVLMYHAVSDEIWGEAELFVSPSDLEAQLQYLTENGYDPIFFSDLYHIEEYDKPVILTFDDGYLDNYTELFPLLKKYNVKATVFMITDAMEYSARYLFPEHIQEMVDSGLVSIQSHTNTHPNLDEISWEEQTQQMAESKLLLIRVTRREPYVLCYPTGRYDSTTLEIIGDYYSFGIKMVGYLYTTGDSPFEVNRYYVSRYTSLSEFASMVE